MAANGPASDFASALWTAGSGCYVVDPRKLSLSVMPECRTQQVGTVDSLRLRMMLVISPAHREDWTFSRGLLVTPVPWVSLVGHSRTCRTIPIGIASGMSGDGCLLLHNCKHKFPAPPAPTEGSILPIAEKVVTCLGEEHGQIWCSNNCEAKVSPPSNRAMKSSRVFWKVSSPAVQSYSSNRSNSLAASTPVSGVSGEITRVNSREGNCYV